MYHVPRVNDWLEGKLIYPIYIEISPSGACNYRCVYCAFDFVEYQPRFLDTELLKQRLSEMAALGLKSVVYAGEGEPLLHEDIAEIILHTRNVGLDVAVTTNGALLNENLVDTALESITWIKVSIGGATKETHAKIHRTSPNDFERVMENMRYAVQVRNDNGYRTTLGMQLLLLPENSNEAVPLAQKAKDIGVDYLVVKPYSQHPLSKTTVYKNIKYSNYFHLSDKLEELNDRDFSVIFRKRTMKKWDEGHRNYKCCLALPFWSYIDAGGNVEGCFNYLGDERFYYGNINENTFAEIWGGEQRKKSLDWTYTKLNVSQCRVNCRMDEINRYLWELKHPPEHVNFV